MVRVISIEAFIRPWISNLRSVQSKEKRFWLEQVSSPIKRYLFNNFPIIILQNGKSMILLRYNHVIPNYVKEQRQKKTIHIQYNKYKIFL